jgi:hypothetical protein
VIHSTRGDKTSDAVFVENTIDLGTLPVEVYMRFDTELNSTGVSEQVPVFFTDQSGFTYEKRVKVPSINYEGNNYPVNTMAYIQDDNGGSARFSVLVDRAHGFSSMESGRLETLIERRTQFDDGRGMSEGVTDNKRTLSNYILLLEPLFTKEDSLFYEGTLPTLNSLHLSHALNYPVSTFGYDDVAGSFVGKHLFSNGGLPIDSHLISLRTISNLELPLELEKPSNEALFILQKFGHLKQSMEPCGRNGTGDNMGIAKTPLLEGGWEFTNLFVRTVRECDLAAVGGEWDKSIGNLSSLYNVAKLGFEITPFLLQF